MQLAHLPLLLLLNLALLLEAVKQKPMIKPGCELVTGSKTCTIDRTLSGFQAKAYRFSCNAASSQPEQIHARWIVNSNGSDCFGFRMTGINAEAQWRMARVVPTAEKTTLEPTPG